MARRSSSPKPVITSHSTITASIIVTQFDFSASPLLIKSLMVNGHEIDSTNSFQLCTALSMHVRTFLHLIQGVDGIEAHIEIPHEGTTVISDIVIPIYLQEWFSGVSALFLRGMHDLAKQFPKKMDLTIEREYRH